MLASRKDGSGGIVDADGVSTLPVISGNGAYVAFESTADQLDNANDSDTQPDIYRRSLGANATQLVNISVGGTKGGPAQKPTIDDTGEVVAWQSTTTVFDPADAVVADPDIYLRSGNADPVLVSRADGNDGAPSGQADGAAVSGDGTKVALRVGSPITTDLDPRQTSIVVRDVAASPRRTFSVSRPGGRPRSATREAAASTSISAPTGASPCSSPSPRDSGSPTPPRTPSSSATSSPTR